MGSKKIVLHFPKELIDKPVISNMVKRYNLEFNILKASITPREEGVLVLELVGEENNLNQALKYLEELKIGIQALSSDIIRDEAKCVHCGVCVVICPTGALSKNEETQEVIFNSEKCIACGLCVKACLYKAMQTKF